MIRSHLLGYDWQAQKRDCPIAADAKAGKPMTKPQSLEWRWIVAYVIMTDSVAARPVRDASRCYRPDGKLQGGILDVMSEELSRKFSAMYPHLVELAKGPPICNFPTIEVRQVKGAAGNCWEPVFTEERFIPRISAEDAEICHRALGIGTDKS